MATKGRAAARASAKAKTASARASVAASKSSGGGSSSSGGGNSSSGGSSVAARASQLIASANAKATTRANSILQTKGLSALNTTGQTYLGNYTVAQLTALDNQAKQQMQSDPAMQEAYTEINTFFSNLDRYDVNTQQSMLEKIQKMANEQVDGAFNTEEEFINRLKAVKKAAIDEKLATFKESEKQGLDKIMTELNQQAGTTGTSFYSQLASNNNLDSGVLGSMADRLVEELSRKQKQETDASALSIKQAEQAASQDTSLADMTAENSLFIGSDSVMAQRETARAERYAELLGLSANQDLLFQTPTALNVNTTPVRKVTADPYRVTNATISTPSPGISRSQSRLSTRLNNAVSRVGVSGLTTTGRNLLSTYGK